MEVSTQQEETSINDSLPLPSGELFNVKASQHMNKISSKSVDTVGPSETEADIPNFFQNESVSSSENSAVQMEIGYSLAELPISNIVSKQGGAMPVAETLRSEDEENTNWLQNKCVLYVEKINLETDKSAHTSLKSTSLLEDAMTSKEVIKNEITNDIIFQNPITDKESTQTECVASQVQIENVISEIEMNYIPELAPVTNKDNSQSFQALANQEIETILDSNGIEGTRKSECSSDDAVFYEAEEVVQNKIAHTAENTDEEHSCQLREVTSAEEVHDESFFDALDTLNSEDENKDTSVIKVETVDTNRVAKSNFYASFQCKNLIEKRICDHRKLKSCYSLLDEIMNSILITHDCLEQVSKFLELNSSATQECKDLALSVIKAFQKKLTADPSANHSNLSSIPTKIHVEENINQVYFIL